MNARPGRRLTACVSAIMAIAVGGAAASTASAAEGAQPHWALITQAAPTFFHPGDRGDFYEVMAINDGGAPTSSEVTVTDVLPPGVTATDVQGGASGVDTPAGVLKCAVKLPAAGTISCRLTAALPPGETLQLRINVDVPARASGTLINEAYIDGGGAALAASVRTETPLVGAHVSVPYGLTTAADLSSLAGVDQQAGSHPEAFTTLLAFNVGFVDKSVGCGVDDGETQDAPGCAEPTSESRTLEVALPPGLVGNPLAVPQCPQIAFHQQGWRQCPADTQVGSMMLYFYGSGLNWQKVPVYNLQPPAGQPAELGFSVSTIAHIGMFFRLRSDGSYGLTAMIPNITEQLVVRAAVLSVWGVPAAPEHNEMRESSVGECASGCASDVAPKPFLTVPTVCTGTPPAMTFAGDSWQKPFASPPLLATTSLAKLEGCEALSLLPAIEVESRSTAAAEPAGYRVNLRVPQTEEPELLATPDVRDVEVAMPPGTVLSPSAANDLVACSTTPEAGRAEGEFGLKDGRRGECPSASRIGSVRIATPLLPEPIVGSVFVGSPECNPCSSTQVAEGRMVPLLIEAEMPEPPPGAKEPGVIVKLAGKTKINGQDGRLTTVFDEDPQLPFSELQIELENGPEAPLVNPGECGPVRASAKITPWSASTPVSVESAPIAMEGCDTAGFSPSVAIGMIGSARGGAFSALSMVLSRPDGQQSLGGVTVHMPPGLSAVLAGVPRCAEAEANAGTCPAASQIGTTTAVVGPGSEPYTIEGGRVYLTERYGPAPFGLSIVTPAKAGPYTLAGVDGEGKEGDGAVVIRAGIEVDPHTAAVTIKSARLPNALDGIPLDIDKVMVNINRERFMFSPTNCNPMNITGTIDSGSGAAASVSYPFQVVNCAALPFTPGFSAETHAHHTRRNGEALDVHVTSAAGQANIAKVHVSIPGVLPVRESPTLENACTEAQFTADPSGCPEDSFVGTATVHTPVLASPLAGPAIFVSHGNAEFPNLDIVLQGEGVTVVLEGSTFIDGKTGVTSSTFASVPDVPISSFELSLPAGPHSALAGEGNLCFKTTTQKKREVVRHNGKVVRRRGRAVHKTVVVKHRKPVRLVMPTQITGQNGAEVQTQTKVAVAGCGAKSETRGKGKAGRRNKHHHGSAHGGSRARGQHRV